MSRRRRALMITLAVAGAVLLIAGVSVAGVLVARDAANDSQAAGHAPTGENTALAAALDELDMDASWRPAETLRGGSAEFETWVGRLFSSSRAPARSKEAAVTMLQRAGYNNVVVMQYVEPREAPYEWVVNAEKDEIYASVYISGDVQYEYENDGDEVSVEAPAGGSAINVNLSESTGSTSD